MLSAQESVLLGFPNRWLDATFTASDEEVGGEASNLATPMHDSGWIVRLWWGPIDAQDETSYDNSPTTEGTFTGGSGYSVSDVITLSDSSTVTVDAVSAGVVTQFTVDSSTSTGAASGTTLTQSSVSPAGGTGFSLTLDSDNVTGGEQSVVVDAGAAVELNAIWCEGARTTGFDPEDLRVKIETDDNAGFTSPTDWTGGAAVAFRMQAGAVPVAYLDMTQPNVGPTDAELARIMADGRLRYLSQQDTSVSERYARLTFTHVGTPTAGQELFLPHLWGGWAWSPDFRPESFRAGWAYEENGRALLRLEMVLQMVREDELWYRAWQEFFAAQGEENRLWVWWQADHEERFYQQAFQARAVPGPIEYGRALFSADAYQMTMPLELTEAFNVERPG